MDYIVERCEMCGATDKRQKQPPVVKHIRQENAPSVGKAVCNDCAKLIDEHNKPYEDAEREADEKAKAIMDAKLAAKLAEEDAKKKQEGLLMETLLQQNQTMMAMMQQTQVMFAAMMEQNAKPRRTRRTGQEVQLPQA